jgi:hypothetical protein
MKTKTRLCEREVEKCLQPFSRAVFPCESLRGAFSQPFRTVVTPGWGLHRGPAPGEEACQRAPSILARILARFASITAAYGHGATMWAGVDAGSQASRSPLTASRARSLPVVASAARPRPRATSLGREAFSRNGLGRARGTQGVEVRA